MTINFVEELETLKKPVWRVVRRYLPAREPAGHYAMVAEYPLRQGKYLRPGLVLLSAAMFGGKPFNFAQGKQRQALLAAAAMQVSEDWILIHDDIEDHSRLRRRKPTLHRLHGQELAINAGDALHMVMWKMLGDNARVMNNSAGWDIFYKMNEILFKATEGQYLELSWIRKNKLAISEKEYLDMVKRKTAYYSIIGPLQIGAMIVGASKKDIQHIATWGLPLGYAFQIWDDCMNLESSAAKQGKEFAGDILEGKRTLMLSHVLARCSKGEQEKIKHIYQKPRPQKTASDVRYVLVLMKKYGSVEYAKNKAQAFSQQAKKLFLANTRHLKNTKAKKIILAGINFVTTRDV